MINSIKQTLQKELTNFMREFTRYSNITKSAFCQQRLKLKPGAFIDLNNSLVEDFYTDNDIETWRGFRLLSVDGSTLELPPSDEIIQEFGVNTESNNIPIAKISTLFDLLNEMILDTKIAPNRSSEYDLAINHLSKLKKGDLLILDRGYKAKWLYYILHEMNIEYVIRLPRDAGWEFDEFWDSKEISKIIEIEKMPFKSRKRLNTLQRPFHPFKIRLVKVILDNGEIEVLATSLLDEEKIPDTHFQRIILQKMGDRN